MDEEGVFRSIWVSKQCYSPQAILTDPQTCYLGFCLWRSAGVCAFASVCLFQHLRTNQLFRCYQATATEFSRSTAAHTSSRVGPLGHLSWRNSTAWFFGSSTVGKYTLIYISHMRVSSPGSSLPPAAGHAHSRKGHGGQDAGCTPEPPTTPSSHARASLSGLSWLPVRAAIPLL